MQVSFEVWAGLCRRPTKLYLTCRFIAIVNGYKQSQTDDLLPWKYEKGEIDASFTINGTFETVKANMQRAVSSNYCFDL